jgi:hypothetical protein
MVLSTGLDSDGEGKESWSEVEQYMWLSVMKTSLCLREGVTILAGCGCHSLHVCIDAR